MRNRLVLYVSAALLAAFTYDAVVRSALTGVVALPSIPGGLKVLTAILALFSLCHAWYSIGGRPTLAFFALSAVISWAYEQAGISTGLVFGAYHYTDYLGGRLGDVPILIPLAWFMMIYPSYVIANLMVDGRPIGTPGGPARLLALTAASAVVMTLWDLVVDPILSGPSVKAWIWETGGPYYGIPIQNYTGWLLTTFTVYLAYRALERRGFRGGPVARTEARLPAGAESPIGRAAAALPVAAYGLMLIADLLSGAAPDGLVLIGPVAMGVPFAAAAWRLGRLGRPPKRIVDAPPGRAPQT
jgi:putative membrane protein